CHCNVSVPNSGLEREMTCRSWGQYNYETFDGLYYYFPGKCSYTLLKDCEDNTQSTVFIQVHNDPECTSLPYSCTRSVSVFLPWEGEIRLQNFNVTFKGQSLKLPHNIHDVELEQIADYILVSQPQGFTLAWHGRNGSIYIKMSPEFVGRTCGLCGNFNADIQDDLKTSYGVFTGDLAMFGNSWVEEEPQQATCSMIPYLYPSPCSAQDPHVLLKVEEVCSSLLKEPFKPCHEFVSPYSYMASCSNDLCLSGPNGDVVCQVFTEYARTCAHAEHPLHNWRKHFPVCIECPAELHYRECITCCPVHCNTENMCIDSKLQCLDGCYCPDGLIYEDGLCVKPSDCPCEHHGMLYPSGHTIQEDCNNCTCVGGVWNCTEHSCPGECSVTGDMYFQSFDGRVYTFPATCHYVLAKSRNSGGFIVTIQNAPCGHNLDGACIQSVNLVLNEDPRTETITNWNSIYNWREFRLYLQLGELWRDDTVGLCGTFNGNIQDDFLAPSGMIESTPQLFGNAWRVSSACVPRPSLPQLDPCDTHQQAAAYAVEKCEVLMQEVFAVCHEHVSPVGFQLQCRADVCRCGTPCLCSALAHYARTCRKHNVIIDFRSHYYAMWCVYVCIYLCDSCTKIPCVCMCYSSDKLCPPGQIYEDCGNMVDGLSASKGLACDRTCESYLLNLTCSIHEPCVPGCICPPGLLKHGDECFEPVACPCFWKGKEYYPGDKVSSPCHQCVCQHGSFQCEFHPCASMCTAYGDRHYRTFDGLLFDYIGACKVYLLKSSADVLISITAENVDCFESGVICRKALLISMGRTFILFDDESGKPSPSSMIDRQNMLIWSAGYFTIIHLLQYELTVLWDRKTTVHIQAGPRWQGKLSGLCGNFDLKTVNEMRTQDNMDSATPQEFGNSWTAAECVHSPDIRHPCSLNPLREPFAKRQCGILLGEVFQVCHPVVDVTWFYMNCLADTCGCSRGGDCEIICRAYGRLKLRKREESGAFWDAATFILHRDTWISGFNSLESLVWPGFFLHYMLSRLQLLKYSHSDHYRRATLFKFSKYPMGSRCQWQYESCANPCFRTCSDPAARSCVTILKVEGCVPQCPAHMVLDEISQRCVYLEDCKLLHPSLLTEEIVTTMKTSPSYTKKPLASTPKTTRITSTASLTPFITVKTRTVSASGLPQITTTTLGPTVTASLFAGTISTSRSTTESTTPTFRVSPLDITSTEHATISQLSTITARTTKPTALFTDSEEPFSAETSKVTKAPALESSTSATTAHLTVPAPLHTLTVTPHTVTPAHSTEFTTAVSTFSTLKTRPVSGIETKEPLVVHTTEKTMPTSSTVAKTSTTHLPTKPTEIPVPAQTMSSVPVTSKSEQTQTVTSKISPVSTKIVQPTSQVITPTAEETSATTTYQPVPTFYTTHTPWSPGVLTSEKTLHTTSGTILTKTPRSPLTTLTTDLPSPAAHVTSTLAPSHTIPAHMTTPRTTPVISTAAVSTTLSTSTSVTVETKIKTVPQAYTPVSPTIPPSTVTVAPQTSTAASASIVTTAKLTTTTEEPRPSTTSRAVSTLSFVTILPQTETTHIRPHTDRAELSTTEATQPSSWSRPLYTSSTSIPKVTPSTERMTTPIFSLTMKETTRATVATHVSPQIPPYSEMVDECTKLICVNGQLLLFNKSQSCPYDSSPPNCGLLGFAVLVNGDKCCPKWACPCRCSVFPDLNVVTFDGNNVAIYKAASYVVTQLPNETVSILVQECHSSDNMVRVIHPIPPLFPLPLNITHESNQVLINRLQRRLYVNSRYAKPRFKKYGFEVLDTGNMYLIRSPAGIKIQWFHSTGMMVIETETYTNKLSTMGLCGCCDGNPLNDLTLSNGTVVAESEDPAVFIDSWQVPNTTSYVSHSRKREVNCSTSDCSDCLNMLNNLTFTACHPHVPPATFCEVWVRDAEYVNNPCVALAAYVASCHKFNICIEWRSPDYCPFLCPETLTYQACLPACTAPSCPSQEFEYDADQCSGLAEGCVCPLGTLLHRPYSTLCIPPNKCACTDSFGAPHAVGEVWKASVDGCCMYKCESDGIVPVELNCSDVPQPVCTKAGEISISLADDNSCCPQRVCVCNQSMCEAVPLECKFGEKMVSYFRHDSCCPEYTCECDPDLCVLDVPVCREDQTLIATRTDGSCCLAHICMCDICSEAVPECESGELLTVDTNSTERCCPVYHCCESYTFHPFSLSLVHIYALQNMQIPLLLFFLQLDRAFLADPKNQCGCKRYQCVRDAVCVDGERGVMRPGQTLMEHSVRGVCYTTRCTHTLDPATGFYRIQASSTNCTAQCQPNQVYVPPKDQSACCGVCRNVSCVHHSDNGSLPGKSWVSDCMRYDCTDTQSGPVLVSYSYSCPPFNETECMKIGGTVMTYMDGCCKTCKEDGKSCQKVTVRMTIRKNDCRSNRPVNIVSCDGKCPSASIYNYNINTYARFCKCCREMGLQRRSVQLYCSGNSTWVSYSIQEPTDCSCQWS
uniref:Otogelin n=1 Tax=Pygocentrus nattereri TaxID=42514 RepID=A0AAR2LEP6_PYGNA